MNLKTLCGLLLLGLLALGARAEEIILLETLHPVLYMNGGIGSDEEAYMRKAGRDFPLRLEFAAHRDNEFVADVRLLIEDDHGAPVFMLPSAGPMTLVMLPPGKYRVLASYRGRTEVHAVILTGKGGSDVLFHWKGTSRP